MTGIRGQSAGTRLAVVYGGDTVTAVLSRPGGGPVPVLFDGSASLPAAVLVAADGQITVGTAAIAASAQRPDGLVANPSLRLTEDRVTVGGVEVDPVDLVAATLRAVATAAARTAEGAATGSVVLAVPARWGPGRRTAARRAAGRAGLPDVRIVDAPAAIVTHHGAGAVDGDPVLVCCHDGGHIEATMLRQTTTGFETLATSPPPAADPAPTAPESAASVRVVADAVDTVARADVPAGELGTVLVDVPAGELAAVTAGLAEHLPNAQPVVVAGFAAGYGALALTAPTHEAHRADGGGDSGSAGRGRVGSPWLAHGARVGVLSAGSLLLLVQAIGGTDRYTGHTIGDPESVYLVTGWAAYALAAASAVLAGVAVAAAAAEWTAARQPAPHRAADAAHTLGYGLVAAASTGLGLACVYAMAAGLSVDAPIGLFLGWTLLPAAALALPVAVAGLALPRAAARDPRAFTRLRLPLTALGLALAGMLAMQTGHRNIPAVPSVLWPWFEHVGGAAIGGAIAFLLVQHTRWRFVATPALAAAFGALTSLDTAPLIGVLLIIAIAIWWMAAGAPIVWVVLRDLTSTVLAVPATPTAPATDPPPTIAAGDADDTPP